jgi:crossover junction endodeoxyribonuclease RuvC
MRILGIDPGCDSAGYAIIDSDGLQHRAILYGAIKTSSRQPFSLRLHKIHQELDAILRREPAGVMAIEQVFSSNNVDSALKLAHARGVIMLLAAQHGMPVSEYSALEIKKGVVGYGRAEKEQVQSMVSFLLQLPSIPTPSDAADALAVAICHANRMQANERLQSAQ